ncbi:methyl-accepting chemotaxis protein [Paenibacillus endoradicis]|uniref:methyl-accepting chemotaxis protein n=1 Tax=Paenibacillus endoradicis TaxID=2972487 RepID=UPI002159902F|nr:methyl-accepting chemotaxis protein [Paenibacillus endoradicis]MCR8658743.1 methyl-accepting chemotaxis protein [Paenibacillus endoradicis]
MEFNVGAFNERDKERIVTSKGRGGFLNSIGTKLFLFFFVSIVCAVIAVGMISYSVSKNAMETKVAEVSTQSLQQTSEKLDYLLNFYENISVQLILDQNLMSDLSYRLNLIESGTTENRMATEGKIFEKLKQAATTNGVYIHLFDEKTYTQLDTGRDYNSAFFTSNNGNVKIDFYKPYFEQIIAGNGKVSWLGAIEKGEEGKEVNYISMGKMIKTNSGNYLLFIEFKEDVIAGALENSAVSAGQMPELVEASGELVYYDKTNVKIVEAKDIKIDEALDAKDEASEKRTHSNITIPTNKQAEPDGSFIKDDALIVYSTSERTGWRLEQSIPIKDLTKGISSILTVTLLNIAGAIIISIILGVIIARMIGRPIKEIGNLMEKVEQGNLSVRMNIQRKDEIGALGESFNNMADNVAKLISRTSGALDYVLSTSNQLQMVSKQMDISAREISIATDEIAKGADELSTQSESGSSHALAIQDEMIVLVQNNIDMQQQAVAVKDESRSGIVQMNLLLQKTNDGEQLTKGTVDRAEKLMDSTKEIRKILVLLDDIAKHTNLLSLNAAIEASRAGEHGRGFMVVAKEIRQLADQSRGSIIVVSEIIGTIVSEIEQTVQAMNASYPIYQEQISVVKRVDTIFKTVDGRMNEFVDKIEHASYSVNNLQTAQSTLSEMILHVSATAEQSTAISQEVASSSSNQLSISEDLIETAQRLNELSIELKEILSEFEV